MPAFDETNSVQKKLDQTPNLKERVKLLPACSPDQTWEYLCAADIFAFPSQQRFEGMPNSLLEASLPEDTPGHIYNQFVVRFPERDRLRTFLQEGGVERQKSTTRFPSAFRNVFRILAAGKETFPTRRLQPMSFWLCRSIRN